jgi:hypothetical protein
VKYGLPVRRAHAVRSILALALVLLATSAARADDPVVVLLERDSGRLCVYRVHEGELVPSVVRALGHELMTEQLTVPPARQRPDGDELRRLVPRGGPPLLLELEAGPTRIRVVHAGRQFGATYELGADGTLRLETVGPDVAPVASPSVVAAISRDDRPAPDVKLDGFRLVLGKVERVLDEDVKHESWTEPGKTQRSTVKDVSAEVKAKSHSLRDARLRTVREGRGVRILVLSAESKLAIYHYDDAGLTLRVVRNVSWDLALEKWPR